MTEPNITVTTYSTPQLVSRELLTDPLDVQAIIWNLMRHKTGAELAAEEARAKAWMAERAALDQAASDRHEAAVADLRDPGTPLALRLAAALDEHKPQNSECRTCGSDEWAEEWPCPTWLAAMGVES